MSWTTTDPKQEKTAFILEAQSGDHSVADMARRYGISRKTAYKWIERFKEEGWEGLEERSRAPQEHPNALGAEVEKLILEFKARWPKWGAPKLLVKLRERLEADCPSESSVSRILQRNGLVRPQGRRRARAQGTALQDYAANNAIWCADFKGWFKTTDGMICTPLTITDGFSRYILRCQGLSQGTGSVVVKPIFEAVMREYGMPEAIRTDNGTPFASTGLGGLTDLSVWWLRLGIRLERSRPGCPQDNGRHERMHRTLKAETATPPRATMAAQQRAFDAFRREYNEERPHEALEGRAPGQIYQPSTREFPERVPEVEYPANWETRQVRPSGQIKWNGKSVYVSHALAGHRIGLEPIGDGTWMTHFAAHPMGVFEERIGRIEPLRGRRKGR